MDMLKIADREFHSRLLVGTGKFASNAAMAAAMDASGAEIVTVALRRVDIENENDNMLAAIDRARYLLLPNTSGARDAAEAVRLAVEGPLSASCPASGLQLHPRATLIVEREAAGKLERKYPSRPAKTSRRRK